MTGPARTNDEAPPGGLVGVRAAVRRIDLAPGAVPAIAHVPAERDRREREHGVAAAEREEHRPEADAEPLDPHADRAGGEVVARLVDDDEERRPRGPPRRSTRTPVMPPAPPRTPPPRTPPPRSRAPATRVGGRPALRQVCRRNASASQPCSTATFGRSAPAVPALLHHEPVPADLDRARVGERPRRLERRDRDAELRDVLRRRSARKRGSSVAAATAIRATVAASEPERPEAADAAAQLVARRGASRTRRAPRRAAPPRGGRARARGRGARAPRRGRCRGARRGRSGRAGVTAGGASR